LVARIADALERRGAVLGKRIRGLDELYWDFELSGMMYALHSRGGYGRGARPQDHAESGPVREKV
jgi:hypothetical protein